MMNTTLSDGSSPGVQFFRLGDGVRLHHMNALPRTNIDAALTHDAFGLVNVNELLGFTAVR